MYCPKCGTQNLDSAAFCASCGQPLAGGGQQSQGNQNQGTQAQNGYNQNGGNPNFNQNGYNQNGYNQNPGQNGQDFTQQAKAAFNSAATTVNNLFDLKKPWATEMDSKLGKFLFSPLTLITVGLFTLNILIAVLTAGDSVSKLFYSIGDWFGRIDYDLEAVFVAIGNQLSATAKIFALIANTPNIVLTVGMWLTIWSAIDKNQPVISAAGPKVIKIMSLISAIASAVGVGITALVLVIYCLILLFKVSFGSFLIMFIVTAFVLAAMAFSTFYKYKIYTTARDFEQTVLTKQGYSPSLLVEIMCYVTAGSNFISTIALFNPASLFNIAISVLFGILIHMLRNTVVPTNYGTFGGNGFGGYNPNNAYDPNNAYNQNNGNNYNGGNGNNTAGF